MMLLPLPVQALVVAMGCGPQDQPFRIAVRDQATHRGVPLVKLTTTSNSRFLSDSAGVVAIDSPELLGQRVFFHVESDGYLVAEDGFGYRGVALLLTPGGAATITLERTNVAERLYRMTGVGIYRDSVQLDDRPPIAKPLVNAQVTGQDTVVVAPYRGKLYWFWGDTNRIGYPLGNFAVSGATSDLPGQGLDPEIGVNLHYFEGADGFAKRMCPVASDALVWLEGLMVVADEQGVERLAARYAVVESLEHMREWGLAVFDDEHEQFASVARFDSHVQHRSAHPFRARSNGVDYYYLFANVRVPATLAALRDPHAYEAFTPLVHGATLDLQHPRLERDAGGRLAYAWKSDTDAIHARELRRLIDAKTITPDEAWIDLRDIATGAPIDAWPSSVCWNAHRQCWIMLAEGWGQVWYAEGDTPLGPWVYARKIVTHEHYSFYNVAQHTFFDAHGGSRIYFEGTYTNTFSGNPEKTPLYDYNQIMYALSLDDERLALPAPVYEIECDRGEREYAMRARLASESLWSRVRAAPFAAMNRAMERRSLVPIYEAATEVGALHAANDGAVPADARVAFYAIAASDPLARDVTGTWQFTVGEAERTLTLQQDRASVARVVRVGTIQHQEAVGSLANGHVHLTLGFLGKIYELEGMWYDADLRGQWRCRDSDAHGDWSAVRVLEPEPQLWSAAVAPLFELRHKVTGARRYAIDPPEGDWQRAASPLCHVWRHPLGMLPLDPAQPSGY